MSRSRRVPWLLLVCALTLSGALATPAAGARSRRSGKLSATSARERIDTWLAHAPNQTRAVFHNERRNPAYAALKRLVMDQRLDPYEIGRIIQNPWIAYRIEGIILGLQTLEDVNGVDELVKRLASANDVGNAVGVAFELRTSVKLRPLLKEINANLNGLETDALLIDGTAVEMKHFTDPENRRPVRKGLDQLELRSAGDGRKLMLVTNQELDPSAQRAAIARLGDRIQLVGFGSLDREVRLKASLGGGLRRP